MLSLLSRHVFSRKPVVLMPGLMGSVLRGNVTEKKHWYCPKEVENSIWFNGKYVFPPFHECLFDSIRLEFDEETQEVRQPHYVNLSIHDFGGINGINHVDTVFYYKHILPYYSIMIKKLEMDGFVVGETIFGAPFDWRFGVYHKQEYWDQLKQLIEKARENNNEKVVLVGHSMGSYMFQVFLTQKTTKEWRAKYVDSVVMIAPSFGGSGWGFGTLWTKRFPFLGVIGEFPETIDSLGGLHIHMLNHEVWGDTTVSIGVHGENLTAKDLTKYLIDNNKLSSGAYKIFKKSEPFFQRAPQEPDVPTAVIYNSGLPNLIGYDFRGRKPKSIYGKGDLMVNAEGPQYVCKNWKNVTCLDISSTNPFSNHLSMLYQDSIHKFVINWVHNR